MLDHPVSCTEVSSEYGISWADLEINHHAPPKLKKKKKIHAAFIIKLPEVFFPSLLPILQIAKIALTVLIMLWNKPWQFSYTILLHSVQSKWWVKSKQMWNWCINWWNWCKNTSGSAKGMLQFSLRNKNCMPLFATEKFASLHSRAHTQIPLYPAAPFFSPESVGNWECKWRQLGVSQLLF